MRPPPHQRPKPTPHKPGSARRSSSSRTPGGRRGGGAPWHLIGGSILGLLLLAGAGLWFASTRTGGAPPAAERADELPGYPPPSSEPAPATATDATPGVTAEAATPTTLPPTPTTAAPTTETPTLAPTPAPAPFDAEALQAALLELVNADRSAAGLQPVEWDAVAALAGQKHAQEMADLGSMSHWNADGFGPDYRYSAAGGQHIVRENVFAYSVTDGEGRAAPVSDWDAVAQQAQASLMASDGHRANILAPEHTHMGIGVAYQPTTGQVRIAQEFVNQYADIQSPPLRAAVGDSFVVRGSLRPGVSNLVANLAYEPFPEPVTIDELNSRSTFNSPAVFIDEPSLVLDGSEFVFEAAIPAGGLLGLYHIRLWADTTHGAQTPIVDFVVTVEG